MLDYRLERSWRKSLKVEVVEGEVVVKAPKWLSQERIEAFLQKHRSWIERKRLQWQEQQRYYFLFGKRLERKGEDVEAVWLEAMRSVVIPRAWELAKRFNEAPKAIKISRAKKRWGSCSSKKTINLSYRLAQLPVELIDYVIIHELCHLKQMNHTQAFWKLVAQKYPNYENAQKRLQDFF